MNFRTKTADRDGYADIARAGLEPLKALGSRWPAIIGAVLTLAMIVGLGRELLGHGLAGLSRSVPQDPRFYVCFGLLYMSPPTGDYVIFRRLWGIPLGGLVALIKKRIANEVVFGYSGDAYFYAWARAKARMVASPFGAVKDVSILSAIAGNAVTLLLVAIALPLGRHLLTHDQFRTVLASAGVTLAISLPFLIFSRRVFSLPRAKLWWVFGVHCIRLLCGSVLIAFAWHFALPGVPVGMWLFLAAGRLLVSRLPLVPNKDLLFANAAILLIGQDQALSELIAFTAALTLVVHVALIVLFGHPCRAHPVARMIRACVALAATVVLAGSASAQVLGSDAAACRPGEGPAIAVEITGLKDRTGELKLELYPGEEADFLKDDRELIAAGKTFRRVVVPTPVKGTPMLCIRVPHRAAMRCC